MAQANENAISRLARVKLDLRNEAPPGVDADFVLKLALKVESRKGCAGNRRARESSCELAAAVVERSVYRQGAPRRSSRVCGRSKPSTRPSLLNSVPLFNVNSVRARLPGRQIDWGGGGKGGGVPRTLDSTMIEARRDPQPGRSCRRGGADRAGVGRHGRKWISPAGAGLYISIVLGAEAHPGLLMRFPWVSRRARRLGPAICSGRMMSFSTGRSAQACSRN